MMSAWDLHKAFPEADFKVRTTMSLEDVILHAGVARRNQNFALNYCLQQAMISLRFVVFGVVQSAFCMQSPNFGDYLM